MSKEFVIPQKIISGEHALENAKDVFRSAGTKAMIVSGKIVEKTGYVKKVIDILEDLNIAYTVFTDITGEPTDEMIDQGTSLYKETHCDFLIGIGGGSPLDAMKAIAIKQSHTDSLSTMMGKSITTPTPPMIAIPTTAGTGSEATWFTIITDTKQDVKMLLKGPSLMPDVAIVDYRLTISSPLAVTAATGLDALTHAIEGFISKKAQPLTDVLALSAIKRIFTYLPQAYKDGENITAREQMSLAALEAGIVITNSSVTVVHGMSRPIGALFHVPHGISNAMLLKKCLQYIQKDCLEQYAVLAKAIGAAPADAPAKEAASCFLSALNDLCRACEIPSLEEYGIDKTTFFTAIDKMADDALQSQSPANAPMPLSKEDLLTIYKDLWK